MTEKENKIKDFNDVLLGFLKELTPLMGDICLKRFKLVTALSKKQPIKSFIQYVVPLQEKIINQDDTYFTDYIQSDDDNEISRFLHLNGLYSTLNQQSKDTVWQYLRLLLAITIEYLQLKKIKS